MTSFLVKFLVKYLAGKNSTTPAHINRRFCVLAYLDAPARPAAIFHPPPTHTPTHGASFSDVHDIVVVVVATIITVKQHFGGFLGVSKTNLLAYLRILKPP